MIIRFTQHVVVYITEWREETLPFALINGQRLNLTWKFPQVAEFPGIVCCFLLANIQYPDIYMYIHVVYACIQLLPL